ncbi:MAG: nuclear transport factor 2 family protein [Acidimicrobiia bacterium]
MSLPVEDVLAIQKLLADYNHAIDSGDADAFAGAFVEDGTLDVGHGVTEGRAALKEFAGALPSMVPGIRHLISNISIEGSGDRASTKVYLQAYVTAGGAAETKLIISGIYRDDLRREDGEWRFVSRTMTPDA